MIHYLFLKETKITTCNSGTYITDNDQYIKKIGANKLYVLALKDFV